MSTMYYVEVLVAHDGYQVWRTIAMPGQRAPLLVIGKDAAQRWERYVARLWGGTTRIMEVHA